MTAPLGAKSRPPDSQDPVKKEYYKSGKIKSESRWRNGFREGRALTCNIFSKLPQRLLLRIENLRQCCKLDFQDVASIASAKLHRLHTQL